MFYWLRLITCLSRLPPLLSSSWCTVMPRVSNSNRHSPLRKGFNTPSSSSRASVDDDTILAIDGALKSSNSTGYERSYYARTRKAFIDFCFQKGFPVEACFPASEDILCAFVLSLAGTQAGSTIRAKISAVKRRHQLHGQPWHGDMKLQAILKHANKITPPSSRLPPRSPVTTDMLEHLINNLDLASPFDAAVYAIAVTAFYGQVRLGELVVKGSSGTTAGIPRISDFKESVKPGSSPSLFLPSTETSLVKGDSVILPKQSILFDPRAAIRHHIRRSGLSPDDYLSSFKDGAVLSLLTQYSFLKRCNEIWARYGYSRYTGESFRIGGAAHFLESNVKPEVVKAMGRWKSDSFLRGSLEALALHASFLPF